MINSGRNTQLKLIHFKFFVLLSQPGVSFKLIGLIAVRLGLFLISILFAVAANASLSDLVIAVQQRAWDKVAESASKMCRLYLLNEALDCCAYQAALNAQVVDVLSEAVVYKRHRQLLDATSDLIRTVKAHEKQALNRNGDSYSGSKLEYMITSNLVYLEEQRSVLADFVRMTKDRAIKQYGLAIHDFELLQMELFGLLRGGHSAEVGRCKGFESVATNMSNGGPLVNGMYGKSGIDNNNSQRDNTVSLIGDGVSDYDVRDLPTNKGDGLQLKAIALVGDMYAGRMALALASLQHELEVIRDHALQGTWSDALSVFRLNQG